MRTIFAFIALTACAPALQQVGSVPGGAIVTADAETRKRWSVEVDLALSIEVNRCLDWFKAKDIDVMRFWPHVRIEVRTFDTARNAGIYHAMLTTPELMRIAWPVTEAPDAVGRLACHEMFHLFARDHEVFRAIGYPW